MDKLPAITIIGPGKVGTAIGVLACRAGWPVAAVGARDEAKAKAAAQRMGTNVRWCGITEAAGSGKLVLLTVSDRAIEPVCEQLARENAFAAGTVAAHCSGALGSDVLGSAREMCGCLLGSIHPLQTFATVERAIDAMAGVYCFCEGDAQAIGILMDLAGAIGATPSKLDASAKALYHAAACMASNYIPALAAAATAIMTKAGIDAKIAAAALAPLINTTGNNVSQIGPAAALTGPVARGDSATVAGHLKALRLLDDEEEGKELERLYRAAGVWAVRLAREKGAIDSITAERLSRIFASERNVQDVR